MQVYIRYCHNYPFLHNWAFPYPCLLQSRCYTNMGKQGSRWLRRPRMSSLAGVCAWGVGWGHILGSSSRGGVQSAEVPLKNAESSILF